MTMTEISKLRNEDLLEFYDSIIQVLTRLDEIQVRKVQIKHTAGPLRKRIRVIRFLIRILPRVDEDMPLKSAAELDALENEESRLELEIARLKNSEAYKNWSLIFREKNDIAYIKYLRQLVADFKATSHAAAILLYQFEQEFKESDDKEQYMNDRAKQLKSLNDFLLTGQQLNETLESLKDSLERLEHQYHNGVISAEDTELLDSILEKCCAILDECL